MTQITGGLARFERTVKVTEWEPKKAVVELNFVVSDGDEHGDILTRAIDLARSKVLGMLDLKPVEGEKRPVGRPPGSKGGQTAIPKNAAPAEVAVDAFDAAVAGEAKPAETPTTKAAAAVAETKKVDAADMSDLSALPADVTDQDLTSVCSRKVREFNGDNVPLRAVISKYVTHPKTVHAMPQSMRAKFLAEVAALKPAAAA